MNVHARLGPRWSDMWLVPNFHELALKFWPERSSTSVPFKGFAARTCVKYHISLTGWYNLTEPSSISFLFSAICPGDTAQMCSLAWNSAARICDKYNFLELAYTIWPEPTSTSLLFTAILQRLWRHCANAKSRLILGCSFMRYVPNSHELAYKK